MHGALLCPVRTCVHEPGLWEDRTFQEGALHGGKDRRLEQASKGLGGTGPAGMLKRGKGETDYLRWYRIHKDPEPSNLNLILEIDVS